MSKYKVTKNAIKCLKCGDVIESTYRHEMVWCSCGSCAVDGGLDYLRRCGNPDEWKDMSESEEVPD